MNLIKTHDKTMSNYPKILLIVPEPFGGSSSSSVTLSNLFKNYPADRMAVIFTKQSQPDFSVCNTYWQLTFPVKKGVINRVPPQKAAKLNNYKTAINAKLPKKFKYFLVPILDLLPVPAISEKFKKWLVNDFKPDIIYTWLGSLQSIEITTQISIIANTPVVPHFMDDWVNSSVSPRIIRPYRKKLITKKMKKLFPLCGGGVGISPLMAEKYKAQFNLEMTYAANGISLGLLKKLSLNKGTTSVDDYFRISILGRLDYGRKEILTKIISSLQKNNLHNALKFNIYGNAYEINELKSTSKVSVNLLPSPADDQLVDLRKNTDCLLYIDEFHSDFRSYFKYSFSGKIPLYLALGKPIISVGPSDIYSISYLDSCNVGPVITTNLISEITNTISDFSLSSKCLHQELGISALNIAKENHTSTIQQRRLYDMLFSILNKGS